MGVPTNPRHKHSTEKANDSLITPSPTGDKTTFFYNN